MARNTRSFNAVLSLIRLFFLIGRTGESGSSSKLQNKNVAKTFLNFRIGFLSDQDLFACLSVSYVVCGSHPSGSFHFFI